MKLEELSAVMLDFDGAPVRFRYQDQDYTVASRPVRWYSRKLWWLQAQSAPKGVGQGLMEVEMWRLWAASETSRIFFELRHELPQDSWIINQINS